MKQRRFFAVTAAITVAAMVTACSGGDDGEADEAREQTQKLIDEAEDMSNEELFEKAIEESDGKTMYGIGNSSRGAEAADNFIEKLQEIDPDYNGKVEWSQPKQNTIFETLQADMTSSDHTYSMTLIQDGNQIQTKMIEPGVLLNFIPKEWAETENVDVDANGTPLTLQTLSKVFMVNNLGDKDYTNVWDFVAEGERPLFMGVNSEPVGKNFLYMLTQEKYADHLKQAFDDLPPNEQSQYEDTVNEVAEDVEELELNGENAKYALAWIKLWVEQYNEETDDGPISQELVTESAAGETGLLVYSKLRSIEESGSSSVHNVDIPVLEDDYSGFGGYGYKHFLMIPSTSPLPWTGMAFNAYMVTEEEGFDAWGKDIGGYSANPEVNQDHSDEGGSEFPQLNDQGYEWWLSDDGGALVVEEPEYAAQVASLMADWVDSFRD